MRVRQEIRKEEVKTGEDYRKELMADLAMFREIVPTLPVKK